MLEILPPNEKQQHKRRRKTRTLKRVDVRQVDVRHVSNFREVVRQHEAATFAELDSVAAVLEADVADEANHASGEGAWRNDETKTESCMIFFLSAEGSRKGARVLLRKRRVLETSLPVICLQFSKLTSVRFTRPSSKRRSPEGSCAEME